MGSLQSSPFGELSATRPPTMTNSEPLDAMARASEPGRTWVVQVSPSLELDSVASPDQLPTVNVWSSTIKLSLKRGRCLSSQPAGLDVLGKIYASTTLSSAIGIFFEGVSAETNMVPP